ncbi:hypothetical protein JG687_00018066 [Phytophthora cactorum]|uniref:Uncharacterized protein n=1 Tax=Phytophthora cactorum TaxID=29920 RepID=A0A329RPQ1_9STRA|nr:hypothetical protein GQ600_17970 [Phytophthora cactorum]KAG2793975.1 hypothetical protein PC111_g22800 [Phytophthora cactorum]KAG2794418.1 hypothetical protein PC112_g23049 [Phytophthora cactorum]KAG2817659.1 hypothetical protein PC113_g22944 [Phytophthora cactorum]KAG2873683.1 hypothetical protein PC114_g25716 [Phytophthora cactorum]
MAASSTEPPPNHVKLRYRALAYVRRIGRQRQPVRATSRRSFTDTGAERSIKDSAGRRPVVRLASKRGFADYGGIRIGGRKSFADSGSKFQQNSLNSNEAVSTPGEIKINTRSRRTSNARKKPNRTRENRVKRRHRFLTSLQNHEDRRFRLFCGCGVEQDAFDPDATPRNKERSVDIRSVGAQAASCDSGFGFTCASPVALPPPLGLEPTRTVPTRLQLRSRDRRRSEEIALSGNSNFSSTGIKRKAPSKSSGYPSYTPNTPPSPFVNDFAPASTFNTTRNRSRVSVGCNGWFLNDDDPAIVGWHRRHSSGEVKPQSYLVQLAEASRESDAACDSDSPKRYKISPYVLGMSSPASSSSAAMSRNEPASSSNSDHDELSNSGIALVPLPTSPPPSTTEFFVTPPTSPRSNSSDLVFNSGSVYDSGLVWRRESRNRSPIKRRWSTGSLS